MGSRPERNLKDDLVHNLHFIGAETKPQRDEVTGT